MPTSSDVVVIGSGIAGLTAAALLAHYGVSVTVLEAHNAPGGCLHSWSRSLPPPFPPQTRVHFDSGASLFSGLASRPTDNPLAAVLDLLREPVPTIEYPDRLTALHFDEGVLRTRIGARDFPDQIAALWGGAAADDWRRLAARARALGEGATAVHPLAVRYDGAIAWTAGLRRPNRLWRALASQRRVGGRCFGDIVRESCKSERMVRRIRTVLPWGLGRASVPGELPFLRRPDSTCHRHHPTHAQRSPIATAHTDHHHPTTGSLYLAPSRRSGLRRSGGSTRCARRRPALEWTG